MSLGVGDGGGLGGGGGLGILAEGGPFLDDLGDEFLGLPAGGAVADGDDADLVLGDEVLEVDLCLRPAVLRRVRVDDAVVEEVAVPVQDGDFAAGAEAGVERQHHLVQDGRLEQEAAQVPGEDVDGVPLGEFGQVATDLAFHAGQEQTFESVGGRGAEEVGVGVAFERQLTERGLFQLGARDLQLDLERAFLVPPVDRQDPVWGDVGDGLGVVEVVAVFQPFAVGDLGLAGHDLAGLPDDPSDGVANGGEFADRLGEDVADAFEDGLGSLHALLGVDELERRGGQVGQRLVAVPDPHGERFQTSVAGVRSLGPLLRLERQVEVFETLRVVGPADRGGQLLGELALGLDGLEDGFLAFGQFAEPADAELNLADRHLVQVAGAFLPVPRDERDRVALVEQLNDALHLHAPNLQILRDPAQVDLNRGVH